MDHLAHRFLPAVAVALDVKPTWFDAIFNDSQLSFRLSHYPPAKAETNHFHYRTKHRQQFHDVSRPDRCAGATGADALGQLAEHTWLVRHQTRRDEALD
jgi:hypothetical protein